ncbi:MAG: cold shock and DUF1294 domain-containing protein [Pedobacter sp.]|nr:cold shock and DUF1294 domain-containing protein [Pedobacter sp.]
MRKTGRISSWKSDKGFGFIAPATGGKELFVHIKALGGSRAPAISSEVSYEEAFDAQGRTRAERVVMVGGGLTPRPALKALGLASVFLATLTGLTVFGLIPLSLLYLYLGMSVLTFLAYSWDKSAAQRGAWRTKENTLHLFSLLGGWPGALYAQQLLRHKSSKQSFRIAYWLTVLLNIAGLAYLLSSHGRWLLHLIADIIPS